MARQLVDSMSGPWTPSDYRDTYTDRVNDLIEAKKSENEFQSAAEPPAATNVADLTAALQASVDAAKKTRRGQTSDASKPRKAAHASNAGTKATDKAQTDGKKTPANGTSARQQRRKRAA